MSTAGQRPAIAGNHALALDGRALSSLKRAAHTGEKGALKQAAAQFEAVFVGMLLKSMRDTIPKDGMFASAQSETFTGMFDQQMSQHIAARGLGLSDLIARQLSRQTSPAPDTARSTDRAAPSLPPLQAAAKSVASSVSGGTAQRLGSASSRSLLQPADDRQGFVARMIAHAKDAERQTGLPASFTVGQAALESGWGKREIAHPDGRSAHNLFAIKAGRDWRGPTVDVSTTEYVGGVARRVVEKFRAYASYAEGFADYARLMGRNPRYHGALSSGRDGSVEGFVNAVQRAGYATDPRYAEKLGSVIRQVARMSQSTSSVDRSV